MKNKFKSLLYNSTKIGNKMNDFLEINVIDRGIIILTKLWNLKMRFIIYSLWLVSTDRFHFYNFTVFLPRKTIGWSVIYKICRRSVSFILLRNLFQLSILTISKISLVIEIVFNCARGLRETNYPVLLLFELSIINNTEHNILRRAL